MTTANASVKYYMKPLKLQQGDWNSLYLKMWPENVLVDGREITTKDDLKWFVEDVMHYGKVERIDVKSYRSKKNEEHRSAFIHFLFWDDNEGKFLREAITHKGEHKVNMSNTTQLEFQNVNYRGTPYFTFRENFNPCSSTDKEEMTVPQLVDRCEKLEMALKDKREIVEDFINNERELLLSDIQYYRSCIYNLQQMMSQGAQDNKNKYYFN